VRILAAFVDWRGKKPFFRLLICAKSAIFAVWYVALTIVDSNLEKKLKNRKLQHPQNELFLNSINSERHEE
jgi:hypothetical protein